MMKKIKILIITILIFLILAIQPITVSKSTKVSKDLIVESCDGSAFVGEMTIYGSGDYNTAYVAANAIQNIVVKVDPEGSAVMFSADYSMYCGGLWDGGRVELRVMGADTKVAETIDEKDGSLYTYLDDCKPGDVLEWELVAAYDDIFFPEPIIVVDIGWGICSRTRSYEHSTHSLIGNMLEKLMVLFSDLMPSFSKIIDQFSTNHMIASGIILCQ